MRDYNLGFISNDDLYEHVKSTIEKFRFNITLEEFNKNLIDPIKLTFDSKIYNYDMATIVENEIMRQIDKSNTNHIGYFHQNLFKYVGKGWVVPDEGFDVINDEMHIYAEVKNKHNTTNSSSAKSLYINMQGKLLEDDQATCYLVEAISKKSQDEPWEITLDKNKRKHKQIRKISIDKFLEMVTGDECAFRNLCQVLPQVIEDIVQKEGVAVLNNTVFTELAEIDPNIIKSLYLLPFDKYQGFDDFEIIE